MSKEASNTLSSTEENFETALTRFLSNDGQAEEVVELLVPFLNEQMKAEGMDGKVELSEKEKNGVIASLEACRANYNESKPGFSSQLLKGVMASMIIAILVGVAAAATLAVGAHVLAIVFTPGSLALGYTPLAVNPFIAPAIGACTAFAGSILSYIGASHITSKTEHEKDKSSMVKNAVAGIKAIVLHISETVRDAKRDGQKFLDNSNVDEKVKTDIIQDKIGKALGSCIELIPKQLQNAMSVSPAPRFRF